MGLFLLPSAAFFPVEITTILLHLYCKRRMSINYHKNENPLNSMRQTNKNTVKFPVWFITAMLLQTAQKSLETLINKVFSNIENVRKMAFYNKITTILLDMRIKSRGGQQAIKYLLN